MINPSEIKHALSEICNSYGKAKEILKKVNGKRDYKEIANILKIQPCKVSNILSKSKTFNLLIKEGKLYKKTPELRHINIDKALKTQKIDLPGETNIKLRKKRKIINTNEIERKILEYFNNNFQKIKHPFSNNSISLHTSKLKRASGKLSYFLEENVGLDQLEGLKIRFFESFAAFFSADRIRKPELINSFSNLIRCFEPYVKKVAVIKTNDHQMGRKSLDQNVISSAVSFSSKVRNNKPGYWENKPIHEACIRTVYPYRHMESHEARDFPCFEIERVVYYMFASIIFINLGGTD